MIVVVSYCIVCLWTMFRVLCVCVLFIVILCACFLLCSVDCAFPIVCLSLVSDCALSIVVSVLLVFLHISYCALLIVPSLLLVFVVCFLLCSVDCGVLMDRTRLCD